MKTKQKKGKIEQINLYSVSQAGYRPWSTIMIEEKIDTILYKISEIIDRLNEED